MNDNLKYTDNDLENAIRNIVLPEMFNNLNMTEFNIIFDCVIKLLNIIAGVYYFNEEIDKYNYKLQLQQNNYQDIKWLILHLLPYINTESNKNDINSINDIYTKCTKKTDINTSEPKYTFSNRQYDLCKRTPNNYTEFRFKNEFLYQNYYLLIDTIITSSHKLHVNWKNIVPYTMNDYEKSALYINTEGNFYNKSINIIDPYEQMNVQNDVMTICKNLNDDKTGLSGLNIMHLYEEISDLYYSIKDYKWIIYDVIEKKDGKMTIRPMCTYLAIRMEDKLEESLLNDIEWDMLSNDIKYIFKDFIDIIVEKYKDPRDGSINQKIVRSFILSFDKSSFKKKAMEHPKKYKPIDHEKYKDLYPVDNVLNEHDEDEYDYNANDANDDDDDDDINEIKKEKRYDADDLLKSFLTLDIGFIYEYIRKSLSILKSTWYGYYLLEKDKKKFRNISPTIDKKPQTDINYNMEFDEINAEIYYGTGQHKDTINRYILYMKNYYDITKLPLEPKNIYNYSKLFVSESIRTDGNSNGKLIFYPKKWCSLTSEQQNNIKKRLNGDEYPYTWFTVNRYIKKTKLADIYNVPNTLDADPKTNKKLRTQITNLLMYANIKQVLIQIIFESMIHKGILTKFLPNNNNNNDDDNYYYSNKNIFDTTQKNPFWNHSYYYLTKTLYKDIPEFKYKDDKDDRITTYNYFSYSKKTKWYDLGAYNWMGQIGTCLRFINNRVVYLTAPTGVGKSTEIPKLFLYYHCAIDHLVSPKIACLQPRKNVTSNNSKYVASTCGVPIFLPNENENKNKNENENKNKNENKNDNENEDEKKTENRYIQFHYGEDNNNKVVYHPVLKYMTGDTFFLQINDPFLKESKKDTEETINEEKQYYDENIYDMIMIDESHEHKTYMDLLITFLKLSLLINNTVRLVIVTATMDDDEARYRRFFRDINDNRKYPLNAWIEKHKLDRICVDRRCHVGPPGHGTMYKITEHYRPIPNNIDKMEHIKKYVNEILNTSKNGDILIFESGMDEILKLTTELNNNTPSNVIVLPYYSQLPKSARDIIEDLSSKKSLIKFDKSLDFASLKSYNGKNTYNRFIIISTNIAEASITIPSLKYVIDVGKVKINKYDYVKRNSELILNDISESSRKQRRGRVGRKSEGTVYFLYEKGQMEKNEIQYDFSQENIYNILYRYLRRDNHENVSLLFKLDPCNKKTKMIKNNLDGSIKKIITHMYFINDKYYEYYGNDTMYDYDNYKKPVNYYRTGFDANTLTDEFGEFYIIHPEEFDIKRNITGEIVNTKQKELQKGSQKGSQKELQKGSQKESNSSKFMLKDKYRGCICSKKIKSFWLILLDYMYIGIVDNIKNSSLNDLVKTSLGDFFIKNKDVLKIEDHNIFRTLVFGISSEEHFDKIIQLCSILKAIEYDVSTLFIKNNDDQKSKNEKPMMAKLYNTYSVNTKNDMKFVMNLLKNFDDVLVSNQLHEFKIEQDTQNHIYENNKNKKNDAKIMEKSKKITTGVKNNTHIRDWCIDNYIDIDVVVKYIGILIENYNRALDLKNQNEHFFEKLGKNIQKIDCDHLTRSLLFGFPQNIVKKMNNSPYYISLYSPNLDTLFLIPKLFGGAPKTFVNKIYLENYILYLNVKYENNMQFIIYIPTKHVMVLSHIYSKITKQIINKKLFIDNQIKKYDADIKSTEPRIKQNAMKNINYDLLSSLLNYNGTIESILQDIINNKILIKKQLKLIIDIDSGLTKYMDYLINKLDAMR